MAPIRASGTALALAGLTVAVNSVAFALALRSPRVVLVFGLVVATVVLAFARPGLVLLVASFGIVVSANLLDMLTTIPTLSFAGFELALSDLFLAALLLAWAGWELRRTGGPRLAEVAREPAFGPWVVFMAIGAFALARGGYGTVSSSRIFGYFVIVPLAFRVLETPRQLRLLGGTIVAGGIVTAVVGAALVAAGRNVGPSGLSTGGVRGLSISGSFLVAGALLYVLATIVAEAHSFRHWTPVVVVALAAGLVASGSRETWVGVMGALAVIAVTSSLGGAFRLGVVLCLAGLMAAAAYSIAPQPARLDQVLAAVEHRLSAVTPTAAAADPSVQVRYDKWRVVWDQMKAHPWFGTGFGYPATYTSNVGGNNFVRNYVDEPENTHLWLWARMGTIGFAAWVVFNLTAFATLVRFGRARAPAARTAALWGAGLLLVIWSGMTFSPVSAFGSTLLLYWLAIALVPLSRRFAR